MKTEPTEARQMLEDSWFFARTSIFFKNDSFKAIDIAFQEGQSSPKIKQLEWDFYGTYYSSKTAFVDYLITQESDFTENYSNCELWVNGFPISHSTHSTLEEAKAAAQADFEKRVKECLDYD